MSIELEQLDTVELPAVSVDVTLYVEVDPFEPVKARVLAELASEIAEPLVAEQLASA